MSAMTPDIPTIAYVLAGSLALTAFLLALAFVRFAEKLARFTETMEAFRITHRAHGHGIERLATATRELAQAQPAATMLESVELVAEPCGGNGCCRGPLPEAGAVTDLPLVAPTASVSAHEAAAAVTRKQTSRDRVNPESVTQSSEHH
jgi:hypothetical protein